MSDEAAMAFSNAQNPSAVHALIVPTMPIATDNGMGRIDRPALVPRLELERLERELAEARDILKDSVTRGDAYMGAMDEAREQRDRMASLLEEILSGYDVVSETASICSVYVATVIEPEIAAVKGGSHE